MGKNFFLDFQILFFAEKSKFIHKNEKDLPFYARYSARASLRERHLVLRSGMKELRDGHPHGDLL